MLALHSHKRYNDRKATDAVCYQNIPFASEAAESQRSRCEYAAKQDELEHFVGSLELVLLCLVSSHV